jgi:L-cysteine/cystine lyase
MTNNKFYFNFGGQGILPKMAFDAIVETYEYLQENGPFSLKANAWVNQQVAELRTVIAQELGVTADTITLTENVTEGCNIALWGIDWQAGDEIVISDCEHPGVLAIVQEIARRFKVEVRTFPILNTLNEGDPVAILQQYLQPQTRLVIISHLLWNTGQILPLTEMVQVCHQYSQSRSQIQVLVDAAQSVGSLPINLMASEVDFYAFTGHKWWCGPAGVGGLYISSEAQKTLNPSFIGWRGIDVSSQGKILGWKEGGERFEVATFSCPLYQGLKSAIITHQQWGNSEKRYQQICQLSAYLWQELSNISGVKCLKSSPPQAGLVSFQLTDNISHHRFVQTLEKQGFMLRTLANPDCIRACVHYFTIPSEIEHLITTIRANLRQ